MAEDVFAWLDACWSKRRPSGTPPTYMMHCFLASDPDLAMAARTLQREIREPDLVFSIWQAELPKGKAAPRSLRYVKAKKPPAAEKLVVAMQRVLAERREVVETMIEIVTDAGRVDELYTEYGVER